MAEALTIRPATSDDARTVTWLVRSAFEIYRGLLDPPSGAINESVATISALLEREHVALALRGDQAVGCIFLDIRGATAYFHRLAVLPEFSHQGIATALVGWAEEMAQAAGVQEISLGVRLALPDNRRFYEKRHYQVIRWGVHTGFAQPTFVTMAKRLAPLWLRKVEVVPYDPCWPAQFEAEAAALRAIFGDQLVTIHHIGSTSVPGLAAKPIIDMIPVVRDVTELWRCNPALVERGYTPRGEFGLPGRRYFSRNTGELRTHHMHCYALDNPEVYRHLVFRDYLRNHPEAVTAYAALKTQLATAHPTSIEAYMDGKDALVKQLERQALAWSRRDFPLNG